jgi:integrase
MELRVTPGWRSKASVRPEIDFQHLRHTCGCHLLQGTWTPRPLTMAEVSRWLGHSSIKVTERHYAALTSNNLHNAVDGSQQAWSVASNKKDI